MENLANPPNQKKSGSRLFFTIFLSILSVLLLFWGYYMFMSIRAASRWVQEINAQHIQNDNQENKQTIEDESLFDLQKRIAFTKSRLAGSRTDSITLAIAVPDSLLILEISGVNVNTVKAGDIKVSRSLHAIEHAALESVISKPLRIHHHLSTIPKEPITEIIAPRNPDEASQVEPVTPDKEADPVFFEITLDYGMRVLVLQEITNLDEKVQRQRFVIRRSLAKFRQNLGKILRLQIPEYHPQILIIIPVNEARAIYRALPERGKVCLLI